MRSKLAAAVPIAILLAAAPGGAYAIFTHQQLIDLAWDGPIRRVLLERYPKLSAKDLEHARAYAYGGSIIQDMGYYPVGSRYFSRPDSLHPQWRLRRRPLPYRAKCR